MDFSTALISILTIHLVASISPGPDFIVVTQKTILQGRKAGIVCGMGVCAGLLFHISYSIVGLTAATKHALWLTPVIGILGGSYLIFLGYKSIKSSLSQEIVTSTDKKKVTVVTSAFWSGLIVNVFNPKAAIYFISLFSIIISPSIGAEKLLLMIVSIIVVQMGWYLIFIFIITIPSIRVKFDSNVYLINRILGVLMLMMGLYMITMFTFD